MEIRKKFNRLIPWDGLWLFLIVIITLIMHITTITEPAELILDEQHYIPAARSIIEERKDPRVEHPTLGKLLFAGSILIFGDNPVGWRALPVLFGTIDIILFFLICRRLHMSKRAIGIAVFLFGFENLTFIQASVAMLDVLFFTFMMASFWLYLRKNYSLSAISLALSALCKLTGALGAGAIGMHWLIMNRATVKETLTLISARALKSPVLRRIWPNVNIELITGSKSWWKVADFAASMLLAPFTFLVLMPICDYLAIGEFTNPIWRIKEMMSLMSTLTFATTQHDSMSRPWEWLYNPKPMPYWYVPSYMSVISYTVWALIIPAAVYLAYRMWKGNSAATFAFWWFVFTYVTWIPASLLTERISFVFYFYPTIGAVCIGIGLAFSKLLEITQRNKNVWQWLVPALIGTFMLAHFVFLVIISPVFT
jgi:dolichyl-phosphate-mannose-protein mannosyltransferase